MRSAATAKRQATARARADEVECVALLVRGEPRSWEAPARWAETLARFREREAAVAC